MNAKNYYCVALCPEHGYVKGKIRMKKTDEGRFFVVKTIKVSSETEAEEVKKRKEAVVIRRRAKKNG